MTCFLCGHEESGSHHLGCAVASVPGLTPLEAAHLGLAAYPESALEPERDEVEILRPGSMTTEPGVEKEPSPETRTVEQCAQGGCDNPKYSDHPRVKYCEEHKDPKNRKE